MNSRFLQALVSIALPILCMEAGEWQGVTTLSTDNSSNPHIALNDNGLGVAVWTRETDNDYLVSTSYYDGIYWSEPVDIATDGQNVNTHISIASSGAQVASWETIHPSGRTIVAVTAETAGIWSAPQIISTGANNGFSSLSTNPNGQTVAGWINFENSTIQIKTHTFTSGWSTAVTLSPEEGNLQSLQLNIDSLGNCIAVWVDVNSGMVYAAHTLSGFNSNWSTPQVISQEGLNSNPSLTYNLTGEALAVWVDNYTYFIYSNHFVNGEWDETPTLIIEDYCYSPVCSGGSNSFFVAWQNFGAGINQIAEGDGSSWNTFYNLSSNTMTEAPFLASASSVAETVFIDLSTSDICNVSFDGQATSPVSVISAGHLNVSPEIASSATLNAACWLCIEGSGQSIQVNVQTVN